MAQVIVNKCASACAPLLPGRRQETDRELLSQYVRGDSLAFSLVHARYQKELFQFMVSRLRDRHLAEDLSQDLWLKISRLAAEPWQWKDDRDSIKSFLFTCAHRLIIDAKRVRGRRQELRAADQRAPTPAFDCDELNGPMGCVDPHAENPAEFIVAADLRERVPLKVRNAINSALADKPEFRDTVLLSLAGKQYKEIAGLMGIPIGTVRSRLHSAMNSMRLYFSKNSDLTAECKEYLGLDEYLGVKLVA